jgi:glycosyltransferase involved in cell wall biosynthesis
MRIALAGTRGIPARYGGFETCAEELSVRLAARGHDVRVYCRSGYYKNKLREYNGVKLFYLPELRIKFLDTLSHTFLSLVHALWQRVDILLVFNTANSPLLLFPRLWGKRVFLHMDGLEWKRGKWGKLGRTYFRYAERLAVKLGIQLITDSEKLQQYYQKRYGRRASFIPYGADLQKSRNPDLLDKYGLKPGEYFLQITRFEPENNPLLSLRAFQRTDTHKSLVLVGGARYGSAYAEEIYSKKDPRIKRPGFIYDPEDLRELLCGCYAYIHGNEVGGTNPALLQAMASGCFVICRDVPYNREVLQDAGIYFKKEKESLLEQLTWTIKNESWLKDQGEAARAIIRERYNWSRVVDRYLEIFG